MQKEHCATLCDLSLCEMPPEKTVTLIKDGKILTENLQKLGHDRPWLTQQLARQSIAHWNDVFLAVYGHDLRCVVYDTAPGQNF